MSFESQQGGQPDSRPPDEVLDNEYSRLLDPDEPNPSAPVETAAVRPTPEGADDSPEAQLQKLFTAIEQKAQYHSPTIDLETPLAREALNLRRVQVPLSSLIDSPYLCSRLTELKNSEKDGEPSINRVRRMLESGFDQSQESMPIYLRLDKHRDGSLAWGLDGGRHRIAAAILSGADSITADVATRRGYLVSDQDRQLWKDLESHQAKSAK